MRYLPSASVVTRWPVPLQPPALLPHMTLAPTSGSEERASRTTPLTTPIAGGGGGGGAVTLPSHANSVPANTKIRKIKKRLMVHSPGHPGARAAACPAHQERNWRDGL